MLWSRTGGALTTFIALEIHPGLPYSRMSYQRLVNKKGKDDYLIGCFSRVIPQNRDRYSSICINKAHVRQQILVVTGKQPMLISLRSLAEL